jgi:hypothetical protein
VKVGKPTVLYQLCNLIALQPAGVLRVSGNGANRSLDMFCNHPVDETSPPSDQEHVLVLTVCGPFNLDNDCVNLIRVAVGEFSEINMVAAEGRQVGIDTISMAAVELLHDRALAVAQRRDV